MRVWCDQSIVIPLGTNLFYERKMEDTKLRLWLVYSSFAVNPAGISDNLPDSLEILKELEILWKFNENQPREC